MKAMLIFTIHDFPALGMVARCIIKGYWDCPVCSPLMKSRRSPVLKKNVYKHQAQRLFKPDHPLQHNTVNFRGDEEWELEPPRVFGDDVIAYALLRQQRLNKGGQPGAVGDPVHNTGIKRLSIFYRLPYWWHLRIRHTINVMHVEKNISASTLGYVLGQKDLVGVHKDLEHLGIWNRLHMQPSRRHGNYLKQAEAAQFLKIVASMKTPKGYSSSLTKRVGDGQLQGLKSHDHHAILQQILPTCIRGLLHLGARDVMIWLGNCFKSICVKAKNPTKMDYLRTYVAETTRWCYGAERYLFVLEQYVQNKSKPEASIATVYLCAEALGLMSEHLKLYPGHHRMWDFDEEDRNGEEVLEGGPIQRTMEDAKVMAIHEHVICNYKATAALYQEFCTARDAYLLATRTYVYEPFSQFLARSVDRMKARREEVHHELLLLAQPPSPDVVKYKSMWAYNNHFCCEDGLVGNPYVTCDSGVASIALTCCQSLRQDCNPVDAVLKHVGTLRSITHVKYGSLKLNIMTCDWIKPNVVGNRTMKTNEHGFWLVKQGAYQLNHSKPYILPLRAFQVFYAPDYVDPV